MTGVQTCALPISISTHAINAGLYKNLPYDPVRDFEMASGQAIYAPKGTPVPIVARLHAEIVKILKGAEGGKLARQFGMEIVAGTPAQLAAHMAKEIPRWAALVKKSGATAD